MGSLTRNTTRSDNAVDCENSFALAIAVLRERVRALPREDQDDLYELLPALLGEDEEERESAQKAVKEILDQTSGKLVNTDLSDEPGESLRSWIEFVSNRLREARKAAGLTQEQLAAKCGVPQGYLSRLESGRHSPTAMTLGKIAGALGLPANYFDPSA